MKTRDEIEAIALEFYPKEPVGLRADKNGNYTDDSEVIYSGGCKREAFIKGYELAQQNQTKCGLCVEPATELTNEKHSESLDTKENEGSELPSEKH